jgi:hypothetical protein
LPPHLNDSSPSSQEDARLIVTHLMERERLPVGPSELDRLVVAYLELRGISEMLFAVVEARYESPALFFDAAPQFEDWWIDASDDGR